MIATFSNFRLDTNNYQLYANNQPVEVEPQVFAVLQALIENRHRIVTKEDLINSVWQGRIMSDAAISSRIKSARKAIGDDGRAQRFIKTLHGVGFRFVADVDIYPSPQSISISENKPEPSAIDIGDKRPSIVVLPFALPAGSEPS
ncbi:MAG: winged helix-turn-helix domain-containing protein, partial [Pseudomonadales bacterium]|nr:winged helix-turn-helix domain-containing protein [Pseudomonadales bacterium]